MKSVLISFLLVTSIYAQAAEMMVIEQMDANGEISHLIKDPKYPGTSFPVLIEKWDQENGLCQLLGYEKAVKHSTELSGKEERVLSISETGEVTQVKTAQSVKETICINQLAKSLVQPLKLKLVFNPTHPNSQLPVAVKTWDKEDGVCVLAGYKKAVPRSTVLSSKSEKVILLNRDGSIDQASTYYGTAEVMCVEN